MSLLFASLHVGKPVLLSTFLFSYVLCLLYARTGGLGLPCAAHFAFNLLAFVSQHYVDFHRIQTLESISSLATWRVQAVLGMLGMALLAALYRRRTARGGLQDYLDRAAHFPQHLRRTARPPPI